VNEAGTLEDNVAPGASDPVGAAPGAAGAPPRGSATAPGEAEGAKGGEACGIS
jgi:hypothetical protein